MRVSVREGPLLSARAVVENFWRATDQSSPRWPSVPRLLWSAASPAPRRRLHHCGAAAAASRHAAPPAPRRDQARRRPATRPPAPLRVQVHHARPPPVEPAEPFGLKAPTAASRSPMHAALARSPEPAPAGGRARCWPDHQLRANFPGARAARSASPPRSGARRKNWAWWGTGRTRFATEVDTKVFYAENLFCRQSRETCESGLRSRRSRSVLIVLISLSEGLPRERTSPSARRGGRPPVSPYTRRGDLRASGSAGPRRRKRNFTDFTVLSTEAARSGLSIRV